MYLGRGRVYEHEMARAVRSGIPRGDHINGDPAGLRLESLDVVLGAAGEVDLAPLLLGKRVDRALGEAAPHKPAQKTDFFFL